MEDYSQYKIIPDVMKGKINIRWIDGSQKTKEIGVFNVLLAENDAKIIGYAKGKKGKNSRGYQFIKMSVDYLLDLGYNIVSIGYRSDKANLMWGKLENDYDVKTELIPPSSVEKKTIINPINLD